VKLCLDEHYAAQIAQSLRDLGRDVDCVKERRELAGMSDAELFARMVAEGRALVTENVSDFAPLVARAGANGEKHHGVIYSSPASMPRSRNTIGIFVEALDALMAAHTGDDDFVDRVAWI
jgi:hypothetical protein